MFLTIYSITISILFFISFFFAVKFGRRLLKVEDSIHQTFDVIDVAEEAINYSLQQPVFYDSPEVRNTINNVKKVRQSLIDIADKLYLSVEYEEENPEDEVLQVPINEEIMRF